MFAKLFKPRLLGIGGGKEIAKRVFIGVSGSVCARIYKNEGGLGFRD